MKKLAFISLLIMPFCNAADPGKGWFAKKIPSRFKKKQVRKQDSISHQQDWDEILGEQIENNPGHFLATVKSLADIPGLPTEVGGEPLTVIDLSRNQLTALLEKIDAPEVRLLWLNYNKIRDINDLHLSNFPQLEGLSLIENQISKIPDHLKLDELMTLILTGNQIYHVDPEIFSQFPKLRELDLNENPITPANVQELKNAAKQIQAKTDRQITIIADDIGDEYIPKDVALIKGKK